MTSSISCYRDRNTTGIIEVPAPLAKRLRSRPSSHPSLSVGPGQACGQRGPEAENGIRKPKPEWLRRKRCPAPLPIAFFGPAVRKPKAAYNPLTFPFLVGEHVTPRKDGPPWPKHRFNSRPTPPREVNAGTSFC